MATTKRMFSNDIVGSDAFFDMPATSQLLYFHLGMRCDDDGFVNPSVTMRMTGASKNDLDVLIGKRFLLPFNNGVMVIKHHRINNNWDARDSRRTLYTEEIKTLLIKENRAYTFDESQGKSVIKTYGKMPVGNPSGTRRISAGRREENRREKKRIEESKKEEEKEVPKFSAQGAEIIKAFTAIDPKNKNYYNNKTQRSACDDLIEFYTLENTLAMIENLPEIYKKFPYLPAMPTTAWELREKWKKIEASAGQQIINKQSKRPTAN